MTASLMRLRSGYKATRCYYCIFTAEIDHQLSRSLCLLSLVAAWNAVSLSLQARMFVGNNPDQQMMHAHYNFKAPAFELLITETRTKLFKIPFVVLKLIRFFKDKQVISFDFLFKICGSFLLFFF